MVETKTTQSARMRLVETGGRTSQDLGMGRIVGQVLVYLYLQPTACSFDELEQDLGLSKAPVSVATRQLEQLGLLQRVWIKGERKRYYRSADNLAQALQQGLLTLVRQKIIFFGGELEATTQMLNLSDQKDTQESIFLEQRIKRATQLQKRLNWILGNPLVHLLTTATSK